MYSFETRLASRANEINNIKRFKNEKCPKLLSTIPLGSGF